jgi:hypothetical protein
MVSEPDSVSPRFPVRLPPAGEQSGTCAKGEEWLDQERR